MFAKIEIFKTFEKVRFYTVRLEIEEYWEEETEADKFFQKFLDEPEKPSSGAELIFNTIIEIGNRGAKKRYFRFENRANALPPPANTLVELGQSEETSGEHLRLYCIRLNEEIVILINGERKTKETAQECPLVAPHFRLANKIAKKIDEALFNREVILKGRALQFDSNFELEL